jgi:DNA repair ATPase RecN
MKQFKDVNACIAQLRAVHARSDIGPEQKKSVEAAIEQLKRLRRKPHAKTVDVYRSVRKVAERLLEAFLR